MCHHEIFFLFFVNAFRLRKASIDFYCRNLRLSKWSYLNSSQLYPAKISIKAAHDTVRYNGVDTSSNTAPAYRNIIRLVEFSADLWNQSCHNNRRKKWSQRCADARMSEQANETRGETFLLSFSCASWPANFSPFSHEIDRVIHNIRAPALSISTFEFRSLSQTSLSRGELCRSHQKATRPGSLEFSLRTFTCFLSQCASIFTLLTRQVNTSAQSAAPEHAVRLADSGFGPLSNS